MANRKPIKNKIETDVILVVKGAGEQAEDEHLNHFLRGFWPAVKLLDKGATIAQVSAGFDDLQPSPHNQDGKSHKHITEIRATYQGRQRRIWLKESYWENEVLPSSALANLSKEWRMASFVFANMFRNIVFSRNTLELKKQRTEGRSSVFQPGSTPGTRPWDYIGSYLSYVLLFLLVFLPFVSNLPSIAWFNEGLQRILPGSLTSSPILAGLMLVLVLGSIWAIAPTLEHSASVYRYRRGGVLKSLPGLPGWILIALIYLLVREPAGYIRFVALLLALQIALIAARSLLWGYRTYANSDVDIAEYYSYREGGKEGDKRIGKVDEHFLTWLPFSPLLYRYLVFLTLPIGFVGTLLAKILKWTRILGGVGETIDKILDGLLVGYMDDVVNYAMDPAQSHRVRSAVMADVIYFHERKFENVPEVDRIHVVAHSQGTPITYETLFHFLDAQYQERVYTYVTIGSVLSYYHQARGVLDLVYYERFPVSASKKQNFPEEFKWMNFWNLSDPITEFYGLDEYSTFEEAPPLDETYVRTRTSPTNIRTRTSLLENHGEYWNNIEQFTLPLARRVLSRTSEMKPQEWAPDIKREPETSKTNPRDWAHYRHHVAVWVAWLSILAVVILAGRSLAATHILDPVFEYFSVLGDNAAAIYQAYNPQQIDEQTLASRRLINVLWTQVLDGALFVLAIWIAADWLGQLGRAVNIGRK